MPWFITALCSDKAMVELRKADHHMARPQRTFGFFDHYHKAFLAVKDNAGNMQEFLYDCLVLEYIESGIHPRVYSPEWYQWDENQKEWCHTECPEEFRNVTNFALG